MAALIAATPNTAAERDALKVTVGEVEAALEPFAKIGAKIERLNMPDSLYLWRPTGLANCVGISVGDVKNARAALSRVPKGV